MWSMVTNTKVCLYGALLLLSNPVDFGAGAHRPYIYTHTNRSLFRSLYYIQNPCYCPYRGSPLPGFACAESAEFEKMVFLLIEFLQ